MPAPGADVEATGVTLVVVTMIAIWLMPFAGSLALGQSLRDDGRIGGATASLPRQLSRRMSLRRV